MEQFQRIEQFIHDVSLCVETSRDLCERVSQDLRPLLHKPWPPKAKLSRSSIPPGADGDVGNRGDAASAEAETLAEVERALVKAQRARELQRRLNPMEELHQEEVIEASAGDQRTGVDLPPKPASQVIDGQEFAVISRSTLQKLFADTKPRISSKDDANLPPKPRPGTAQARAAYGAKVPRPKSSAKSRFTTTSSEIGRNVAAKPKANTLGNKLTNPQLVSGKKEPTDKTKLTQTVNRTKNPTSAGNEKVVKLEKVGKPRYVTKNKRSTVGMNREEPSLNSPEARKGKNQNFVGVSKKPDTVGDKQETSVTEVGSLVQETADLNLKEMSSDRATSSGRGDREAQIQEDCPRPFLLKRDGHDLRVPSRLRKLQSDIARLKQRLSSEMTPNEQSSHSQHFRHRLESKFQQSSQSLSLRDVQDVTRDCRHLIHVAKSALTEFPGHGKASWDSRCRLLVLTKALRAKLDTIKADFENVAEGEKRFLSKDHPALPPASQLDSSGGAVHQNVCHPPSTAFFLPVQHGDFHGCLTHLDGTSRGQRCFEYNNLKELQRFATLQHDVQRLTLQIQLEKLIGEEILPILVDLDPSDSNFVPLYRTLYGLLCHGGRLYPSVVGDSMESTSEMETA
ncbi:uncharacterized protein LOC110985614 [Acanthaster planci]|uniref:Uncharacterized protein LOC110985614 n=1 Tax=Acanthaster planci TaxID=133434 RepID=A0A8B7Z9U8_ACAPL|nr:uncharacterized protein LOC110985614 [Acanthaster planci]